MRKLRATLLFTLMALGPTFLILSYAFHAEVNRDCGNRSYYVQIGEGSLYISAGEFSCEPLPQELIDLKKGGYVAGDQLYMHETKGWSWSFEIGRNHCLDYMNQGSIAGFNGQRWLPDPREGNYAAFLRIPFWFLSCVIFLMGLWIYRRQKRKVSKAFPLDLLIGKSKKT